MARGSGGGARGGAPARQAKGAAAGGAARRRSAADAAAHADRLAELDGAVLKALLERHYEVTQGEADEGDEGDEAALEAAATLKDVHACIEIILGRRCATRWPLTS